MSGIGKPAKKTKAEASFRLAPGTDGMLQCIFVEGKCVPLWPQYEHRTAEDSFIRVDRQEHWMLQLTGALRNSVIRGYEPQKHGEKKQPYTKKLIPWLCNGLLHEFRRALVQASQSTTEKLPDVLPIKMHSCEVLASTNATHLHILADGKAAQWIQTALRQTVTQYLDIEMRAMSHNASKSDGDDSVSVSRMWRIGIRDKVHWRPETRSWKLRFHGEHGCAETFCKQNKISLTVPGNLNDSNFKVEKEKAFRDACDVWNAVDGTRRKRIKIPAKNDSMQMVPVVKARAMSHSDSDSDSAAD